MKFQIKPLLPHLLAIGIFLVVSLIYCQPALEGKVLNAHDNQGWKGMAQQSIEAKEKNGKIPLWTNSLFSGMPGYQVAMENSHKISFDYMSHVLTLGLPKPANFLFLACIGFYMLALALGASPVVAVMGALSYAFSTYNAIIIGAGHDTKMLALGYAPIVVAGLLLLFQKKYWIGAATMASGLSLQLSTSHIQIVYYTLIILAFISLGFFIDAIRKKTTGIAIKAIGIAAICGMLGLGSNAVITLMNWDYSKASMRGGASELKSSNDKNATEGGLDKDYAFKYSVGIAETFTLLVPGIYGGSNGGDEYKTSAFADKLTEVGYPEDQAMQYANGISYWGKQQPTSGPVYFGAALILLFILSLFLEKSWLKWSLLGAGLFGILLAWGKNLEAINYFLFDYMPLYKKFRAPSMGLIIPQLTFAMLATIGVQKLIFGNASMDELKNALKKTLLTIGATGIILTILYFSFEYSGASDKEIRENMSNAMLQQLNNGAPPTPDMQQKADSFGREFISAIQSDRKSLYGSDLLRSFFFILAVFLVAWAVSQKKLNSMMAGIALVFLCFMDLVMIDRRYLNDEKYVEAGDFDNAFSMTEADKQIKQDTSYYRVFNMTGDPFNESMTSYHHNSIGGYHPAKLRIYQDLIENQISKNNMQVMNMLNTKYFITSNPGTGQPVAQLNPEAFGPCWLAKHVQYVPDAKGEMNALNTIGLKDTAVVQSRYQKEISLPVADSTAKIRLIENRNDIILYESESTQPQFAVFSEIWYDRGWRALVDNKESSIIKTNYALRGLSLSPGKHRIEFRFEPKAYSIGNTLVLICSLLTYALLVAGIIFQVKGNNRQQA